MTIDIWVKEWLANMYAKLCMFWIGWMAIQTGPSEV